MKKQKEAEKRQADLRKKRSIVRLESAMSVKSQKLSVLVKDIDNRIGNQRDGESKITKTFKILRRRVQDVELLEKGLYDSDSQDISKSRVATDKKNIDDLFNIAQDG